MDLRREKTWRGVRMSWIIRKFASGGTIARSARSLRLTPGGNRMWSLLGEDETERAPSAGLGLADAIWGEQFYDWVENEF